ncbi:hypothetical protein [Xanthomonas vesicatoria]|uniref:hypothetical protein n=1 Tax=Xanthomonas vesicatoria TaxID=56460 RepID=UPI001E340973|nr:hypothetical protein [Xanthomonas vesicatoria]MCC8628872.1 hypothetical protein [Xanthomonas vesicatoria]MDG4483907.1 hypothetical protein [Xanthomonas vesicatoria]
MSRTPMNSYELADTWIKGLGFFAIVASGLFAFYQYRGVKQAEVETEFIKTQLSTVDLILASAIEIDGEVDLEKKMRLATDLDNIAMIKGRAYLSGDLYAALSPVRDYLNVCVLKKKSGVCQWTSASQSTAGFAKAARQNFDRAWQLDLKAIGEEEPYAGNQ